VNELEALRKALLDPNQSGKSALVGDYERELAAYFGCRHAVALNSGSAALEAALVALGARPGTTILVSAAAPLPTLMPLIATGADLRFVDSNIDNPGMDPVDLASCIDGSVIAAVQVPLWGYPLDYSQIQPLLDDAGIPLVEDAAHAHGARIDDAHVGTLGRVGCFSTHQMKPLSTGEGGFILTDDAAVESAVRRYSRIGNLDGASLGRNFKPSAFTAALGTARLSGLTHKVQLSRTSALHLLSQLPKGLSEEMAHIGTANGYNLVVRVASRTSALALHQRLAEHGIETDPVRYRYKVGYRHPITQRWARECRQAENLIDSLIQLPTGAADPRELAARVAAAWAAV
jgi:perosamine synthetase